MAGKRDPVRSCVPMRLPSFVAALVTVAAAAAGPALAGGPDGLAPAFVVRTLDGRTFRLQTQRGNPVILDFWATWCAPCRKSLPHLARLQERHAGDGLVVLGLSVDDDDPSAVKRFGEKMGLKLRLAMADEKLLDLYGPIRLLPTTFFINRRGEVVRRTVGYLDEDTLEEYVRELY